MADCTFCSLIIRDNKAALVETQNTIAIPNRYPAAKGHFLIMPKVHLEKLEDVIEYPWLVVELLTLVKYVYKYLEISLNCTGYNLLANEGKSAGQTILHFHFHLIPTYGEKVSTRFSRKGEEKKEISTEDFYSLKKIFPDNLKYLKVEKEFK